MPGFTLKKNRWFVEGVPLSAVAEKVGTPSYVYSHSAFERRFREIDRAYAARPHLVAYSLKANANLALVRSLGQQGAGADVVSGGELYKARQAGIPADRIIYAGVGKTNEEIRYALQEGIRYFNVESLPEMQAIDEVAASLDQTASVAVRFNPDVDAMTHHYITTGKKESKFGISIADVDDVIETTRKCRHVRFTGVHAHIGSQITSTAPLKTAVAVLEHLVQYLRQEGVAITTLNLGGGYGIPYNGEKVPKASDWARQVLPAVKRLNVFLIVEPGRYISGNSGVLLTRVLYVKKSHAKTFVIVDAGMNDLLRPALYGAHHEIAPVEIRGKARVKVDVVGPICESSDFLAKDRLLPVVSRGDVLAVFSAGAYGSTMASQYNGRPLVPEVVVRGSRVVVARRRQRREELLTLESAEKL